MILTITEFIGHLHPVLVHLPIGILLIGLLLQWFSSRPSYSATRPVVPVVMLWGAVTATFSCVTGYILSSTGDYDESLVSSHQWMGISVAVVAFAIYIQEKKFRGRIHGAILPVLLLVLISVTGHLGGTLTHGSDYLSGPLLDALGKDSNASQEIRPVANVQEAMVYADVVEPILRTKCYSCHGAGKQKGGLKLTDSISIVKGGKDGVVLTRGNAEHSELIKRLLTDDKDKHMPPKEKPQLTQGQVAILQWWIDNGALFAKKIKEIEQPAKIKPVLLALQKTEVKPIAFTNIPSGEVAQADYKIIEQLDKKNIVVLPVSNTSHYLMANFITDSIVTEEDLNKLTGLKTQLVWLKMGFTNMDDAKLGTIAKLDNLRELSLEHTQITDKEIGRLSALKNLQYLNLVGTKVTAAGLLQLKNLKSLKYLYLYRTGVKQADWEQLKKAFPSARLDSGGYSLPLLAGDTSMIKP